MSSNDAPGAIGGTVLYHYHPSLELAAIFTTAFALATALQVYQTFRAKAWYMTPLIIGGACEVVGYIGRILGANEYPDITLGPYIIQSVLILIAPALIAASIYMMLGYTIRATNGDRYSLVRERILTKVFVIGDVCSFMIQSTGAGLLTKKEQKSVDAGNWIIIGGLAVQIIFFGLFLVVVMMFWGRLTADKSLSRQLKHNGIHWKFSLATLFVSSVLIFIRSIFRVAEYVQGQDGYLLSHELYLYIFDAALMFAAIAVFNVVHPTRVSATVEGGKAVFNVFQVKGVTSAMPSKTSGSSSDEETAYSPVPLGERSQMTE